MAYNLKEVMANKPSRFTEGHRMCAGCGAPVVARMIMRALKTEDHAVVANATGCMEVSTFIYPYTAWTDSFIHTAFENAGATCAGAEAAYKSMKRQGKLPQDKDTKFIAFGGDGGTYDIGLQSLSGAMERGHDMVYVCYDNGAYMNTGIQRSSATPKFADTTTSPAGKVTPGKMQVRKDLAKVMVGHHIPYVAQTLAMNNFKDLYEKAEKAIYTEGPAFLNVMAPCPRGWGYATEDLMKINKLAADTCYWPLYEVVDGKYKITYKPAKKLPIEEFLRPQKRFKHMFKPGNEWMIQEFQRVVDERWQELLDLEEITNRDARKKSVLKCAKYILMDLNILHLLIFQNVDVVHLQFQIQLYFLLFLYSVLYLLFPLLQQIQMLKGLNKLFGIHYCVQLQLLNHISDHFL